MKNWLLGMACTVRSLAGLVQPAYTVAQNKININDKFQFLLLFLENESDIIHLKMKMKWITLEGGLSHKGLFCLSGQVQTCL